MSVCSAGEARYGTVPVRGDIRLAVRYLPSDAALELTVHQCRNLAAADARRNKSDPYVRGWAPTWADGVEREGGRTGGESVALSASWGGSVWRL